MVLEKMLSKTKRFGRKLLTGVLVTGASSFACSQKVDVTTPDDITIDPKHVGMIKGRVIAPQIGEGNKVYDMGISGIEIELWKDDEKTNFKTNSISDGEYSIDNIPAGSYNVKANYNPRFDHEGLGKNLNYGSDTAPITVIKQKVTQVKDSRIFPGYLSKKQILYGKIYEEDKATPFANERVFLHGADFGCSAPTLDEILTSSNGSYAFYVGPRRYCMTGSNIIIRFMDGNISSEIMKDGLHKKDAYAIRID